jgi:hypothetical protein
MRGLVRGVVAVLLTLAIWPGAAAAQAGGDGARGIGVVTTLAGTATVARASLPTPRPLSFKDDVFVRDHIATAEKSVVRVLLGGKALVTVRELSSLTITEETGRSTVDLTSGKIAMGVVRRRMRPGEVIEIRTPNAIAAIRGTVLVVELIPAPGGTAERPNYTTKVHVLHGLVEVFDPNDPSAPPAQVGALQSWSRTGSEPFSPTTFPMAGVGQMFADLHSAPQVAGPPGEFMAAFAAREQSRALAVAEFLAAEMAGASAGGDGAASTAPDGLSSDPFGATTAPTVPVVTQVLSGSPGNMAGAGTPTGPARFSYNGQTVTTPGDLYALANGQSDTTTGPILEAVNSTLGVGNDILRVAGGSTLAGSGTAALVDMAGTSTSAAGSLLAVSGGAVLDLIRASAPLLNLTQRAALATQGSLATLSGGATVQLGQLAALHASSVSISTHALSLSGGARMTVSGDLFRLASGSDLRITNGALVSLTGGSALNVAGALVNFIGTGNRLSITNNLCGNGGCAMVGNLPVLVRGGGSVTLSNPIQNLAGNTLSVAPGSAVISVTGGAQLRQGL